MVEDWVFIKHLIFVCWMRNSFIDEFAFRLATENWSLNTLFGSRQVSVTLWAWVICLSKIVTLSILRGMSDMISSILHEFVIGILSYYSCFFCDLILPISLQYIIPAIYGGMLLKKVLKILFSFNFISFGFLHIEHISDLIYLKY